MGFCAQCGLCCEVLRFPKTKKQFRVHPLFTDERFFLLHVIRRVSKKRAAELNPAIVKDNPGFYYTCDWYDPKTKLCTQYERRTNICKGFPWYERKPTPKGMDAFPTCSYWLDVPKEDWPDGVIPLTEVVTK